MNSKVTVGWKERAALPDWGVSSIVAKVDTGARTSALHVEEITPVGESGLRFRLVRSLKDPSKNPIVEANWVRRTVVRSSTGTTQSRYVVSTRLLLGGVDKQIEVSLVSRPHMLCRMLLGRTALAKDFLVDVDSTHLAS